MARIPDQVVDKIRSVNILDIAKHFIPGMKKKGGNWWARSPWNDADQTPSFAVSPSKNIFKCFSTGHGGGVIELVMRLENCEYRDALVIIAGIAGIDMPKDTGPNIQSTHSRVFEINSKVSAHFQKTLMMDSNALEYLIGVRKLSLEAIAYFEIGLCVDSPVNDGFSKDSLIEAGIIRVGKGGTSTYCPFVRRITFPIRDILGRVVGFSGRTFLQGDNRSKYTNTHETQFFKKSENLFGVWKNKSAIRRSGAILVEGQFDVIGLWDSGIKNAAASVGTSLTSGQVSLLSRLSDSISIMYDGDAAGQKAALRAANVVIKKGIVPSIISVPKGKDPE